MQIADQSPPVSKAYSSQSLVPPPNQSTYLPNYVLPRGRQETHLVTLIASLRLLLDHELLILHLVDHRVLNTTALGEKLLQDGGLKGGERADLVANESGFLVVCGDPRVELGEGVGGVDGGVGEGEGGEGGESVGSVDLDSGGGNTDLSGVGAGGLNLEGGRGCGAVHCVAIGDLNDVGGGAERCGGVVVVGRHREVLNLILTVLTLKLANLSAFR